LIEREGAIPAPYLAKHKWVALEQFDTLPDAELKPLLARAYEIVSAKLPKRRAAKSAPKKPARATKRPSTRRAKSRA